MIQAGFSGVLSLELFNRTYWEQDPQLVANTGLAKMKLAWSKPPKASSIEDHFDSGMFFPWGLALANCFLDRVALADRGW